MATANADLGKGGECGNFLLAAGCQRAVGEHIIFADVSAIEFARQCLMLTMLWMMQLARGLGFRRPGFQDTEFGLQQAYL
jgi:hypothetical protein